MPAEVICSLTLEGPADLPCLERVHDLVDQLWVRVPDVEATDRYRFGTAVIEVAGNIVEHGGDDVRLRLRLVARDSSVEAYFRDTGPEIVLDELTGELPEPLAEKGRGIALARAALDDVEYEREGEANLWRLRQRRAG